MEKFCKEQTGDQAVWNIQDRSYSSVHSVTPNPVISTYGLKPQISVLSKSLLKCQILQPEYDKKIQIYNANSKKILNKTVTLKRLTYNTFPPVREKPSLFICRSRQNTGLAKETEVKDIRQLPGNDVISNKKQYKFQKVVINKGNIRSSVTTNKEQAKESQAIMSHNDRSNDQLTSNPVIVNEGSKNIFYASSAPSLPVIQRNPGISFQAPDIQTNSFVSMRIISPGSKKIVKLYPRVLARTTSQKPFDSDSSFVTIHNNHVMVNDQPVDTNFEEADRIISENNNYMRKGVISESNDISNQSSFCNDRLEKIFESANKVPKRSSKIFKPEGLLPIDGSTNSERIFGEMVIPNSVICKKEDDFFVNPLLSSPSEIVKVNEGVNFSSTEMDSINESRTSSETKKKLFSCLGPMLRIPEKNNLGVFQIPRPLTTTYGRNKMQSSEKINKLMPCIQVNTISKVGQKISIEGQTCEIGNYPFIKKDESTQINQPKIINVPVLEEIQDKARMTTTNNDSAISRNYKNITSETPKVKVVYIEDEMKINYGNQTAASIHVDKMALKNPKGDECPVDSNIENSTSKTLKRDQVDISNQLFKKQTLAKKETSILKNETVVENEKNTRNNDLMDTNEIKQEIVVTSNETSIPKNETVVENEENTCKNDLMDTNEIKQEVVVTSNELGVEKLNSSNLTRGYKEIVTEMGCHNTSDVNKKTELIDKLHTRSEITNKELDNLSSVNCVQVALLDKKDNVKFKPDNNGNESTLKVKEIIFEGRNNAIEEQTNKEVVTIYGPNDQEPVILTAEPFCDPVKILESVFAPTPTEVEHAEKESLFLKNEHRKSETDTKSNSSLLKSEAKVDSKQDDSSDIVKSLVMRQFSTTPSTEAGFSNESFELFAQNVIIDIDNNEYSPKDSPTETLLNTEEVKCEDDIIEIDEFERLKNLNVMSEKIQEVSKSIFNEGKTIQNYRQNESNDLELLRKPSEEKIQMVPKSIAEIIVTKDGESRDKDYIFVEDPTVKTLSLKENLPNNHKQKSRLFVQCRRKHLRKKIRVLLKVIRKRINVVRKRCDRFNVPLNLVSMIVKDKNISITILMQKIKHLCTIFGFINKLLLSFGTKDFMNLKGVLKKFSRSYDTRKNKRYLKITNGNKRAVENKRITIGESEDRPNSPKMILQQKISVPESQETDPLALKQTRKRCVMNSSALKSSNASENVCSTKDKIVNRVSRDQKRKNDNRQISSEPTCTKILRSHTRASQEQSAVEQAELRSPKKEKNQHLIPPKKTRRSSATSMHRYPLRSRLIGNSKFMNAIKKVYFYGNFCICFNHSYFHF